MKVDDRLNGQHAAYRKRVRPAQVLIVIILALFLYIFYMHTFNKVIVGDECKTVLLPNNIKLCLPKKYFMSKQYETKSWDLTKRQSVGFSVPQEILPVIPTQYKTNFKLISLSITVNGDSLFVEKRRRVLDAIFNDTKENELSTRNKFINKEINIFSPINEQVYFVCKKLYPDSKEFCFAYVPWSLTSQGLNIEIEFPVAREGILNWKEQELKVKSFIDAYRVMEPA